ncbi:MAG TPA: DUF255 domain-containing protein [Bacteroidia bacterium]|jgi:uncharacterized protein YyaL (SSP411 family)|nr:DUF255 domain-containing protein [Bacteroidia bacterium]
MKNLLLILSFYISSICIGQTAKINWQAWGEKPFLKAKKEHKPIFLDVGTEWCTACNFMEAETYTDTTVIGILNRNFILIKADAEAQPDVGARFLEWGWPALIFLDSSGNQLQALQGNRRPDVFIPILNTFLQDYKNGKITADNKDFYSPEVPDKSTIGELYKKAENQLADYYDTLYAGWGFVLKIPLYQPIEYSFWNARLNKKPSEQKKALLSLNQYTKISDRIWGGVYFGCASNRSWKNAQPEKRSEYQGGVLHNYAEAYMATGDVRWLKEAQLIKSYLLRFMLSKEDDLFFNSQEEYITPDGNPPGMPPEKYFTLPNSERLKYGIPPIDKTLYSDINFRIVKGFLKLYEATQNPEDLKIALATSKKLIDKAYLPSGWFKTVVENKNATKRIRDLPSDSAQQNVLYLKTQAHAAIALLMLYQFTNDTTWLVICQKLNKVVYEQLYDKENGGFFSTNLMPVTLNGKRTQTKVLTENALYARFLVELSDITGDENLSKIAEGCLRAVGSDKIMQYEERLIAEYALAADKLIKHHLVFTIVTTDANSDETKKLIKQVLSYYHPAKLMKVEKPDHYPDMGKPTLFICSKVVCSQPIFYSETIKKDIDAFINRLK